MCDCTFSLSPFTALYVRHLRHRRLKRHQQSYPRFVRQNQICLPGLRRSSRTGSGRSTSPREGRVRASGRCGGRGDGRRSRCTGCPGVYQRAQVPDSRSVTSRRTEPRTVRKIGNFREIFFVRPDSLYSRSMPGSGRRPAAELSRCAPSALPLSTSSCFAELVSNGPLPLPVAVGWPRPPHDVCRNLSRLPECG